jgi:DNA-binding MurR/RpiR family transcriptional regulator
LSNTSGAVGTTVISLSTGAQKDIATLADVTILTTNSKPPPASKAVKVGWRRVRNQVRK